jgi:hypothetical protein
MPNRILREGIVTSSRIAKLNWAEECFYRRLMSVVDDYGRYFADPGLLRAACYPRHLSKVSDSDIEKWLQATEKAALVRVYPAEDGERYLELLDFNQQVRAKKSRFPNLPIECVADDKQKTADAHLVVSVVEDVSVGDKPLCKPAAKPKKTLLPEDFGISEQVRKWAKENNHHSLEKHLEHFIGSAKARGYQYLDWDEAFKNAIRTNWAKIPEPPSFSHPVVHTPVITGNWWETPSGIEHKGKELGIDQDRFGGFIPFKLAVLDKAGPGPWRQQ